MKIGTTGKVTGLAEPNACAHEAQMLTTKLPQSEDAMALSVTDHSVDEVLTNSPTLVLVRNALVNLLGPGFRASELTPDRLLIEDLGLDSFKFVELTVRLEELLGVLEFPMQAWVDQQMDTGLPLSVGLLAAECESVLKQNREFKP